MKPTILLLLHAGPEIAVASTKAYTAQIAALAFLAKAVGEANGNEKAKAFDLVHEYLSWLSLSINSSEKELIDAKVVTSLKQHATPFTSDVVKTTMWLWKLVSNSKRFLTSNVKVLRLENSSMEPLP